MTRRLSTVGQIMLVLYIPKTGLPKTLKRSPICNVTKQMPNLIYARIPAN